MAAAEPGAADDGGRDGVDLEPDPRGGQRGAGARGEQEAREAGEAAHEGIAGDDDTADRHAREPRRLLIPADGVDPSPKLGVAQDDRSHHDRADEEESGDGEAATHPAERERGDPHRIAFGAMDGAFAGDQDEAAHEARHGERRNQRVDADAADQGAVEGADESAGSNTGKTAQRQEQRVARAEHENRDEAGHRSNRTYGKVEPAQDHDHRHADGRHAHHRGLGQDVREVQRIAEGLVGGEQDDRRQEQGDHEAVAPEKRDQGLPVHESPRAGLRGVTVLRVGHRRLHDIV